MRTSRLARPVAGLITFGLLVAACGSDPVAAPDELTDPDQTAPNTTLPDPRDPTTQPPISMPDRFLSSTSTDVAAVTTTALGFHLLTEASKLAQPGENVVVSPLSVALALGMLEPGAVGDGQAALRDLLGITDPTAWHESINALSQQLVSRFADQPLDNEADPESDHGDLLIRIANAAFVDPDYPLAPGYLEVVGRNYGPAVEALDFSDRAAAAARINQFVSDVTDGRIDDIVQAEAINPDSVLALVNALLLRASWLTPFDAALTVDAPFTRADGTAVQVPMMHGTSSSSARGTDWIGATNILSGDLALQVILPNEGAFDQVAARFDQIPSEYANQKTIGAGLTMPRFETRVSVPLTDVVKALGLGPLFEMGNLTGVADDPRLVLDSAFHQTFLSVDETGLEAAAATVLMMYPASMPEIEPVDVVLDRPFLFRIFDQTTGATLFTGSIADPS
jgi:serpin B